MSASARVGRVRCGTARTRAQAKLNLFLHILAREATGYHQLETLFCRLELGDDVTVRTGTRGRSLDLSGAVIPPGGLGPVEQNLAWRATTAYAAATGWPNEWAIEIHKRIPVGGGLGGGSADAGAVLRALNALAPRPLSEAALVALAAPLGADVPFLTLESPLALGWGRGERLLTLPALPSREVVLVCFPFGVATRDAYAWLDADRGGSVPEAVVRNVARLGAWVDIARAAGNDFEAVVAARHADVARALGALRSSAGSEATSFAVLAGSGSTVAFVSEQPLAIAGAMSDPGWRIVRTRTADRVASVEVTDA